MGPKLLSISKSRLLLGNSISSAKIALTREDGANDKLAKLLGGLEVYEIPCIMFDTGEDASKLPKAIASHDLILITSPQAAKMFLESWKIAGKPDNLKIATVGDGSSKSLIAEGLIPVFQPSDSTARTLAAELPLSLGSTVLYPSSAIADNTLLEGLEKRGFVVSLSAVKMRRKMSS
jgi:uroporphyrinogen-III synthase